MRHKHASKWPTWEQKSRHTNPDPEHTWNGRSPRLHCQHIHKRKAGAATCSHRSMFPFLLRWLLTSRFVSYPSVLVPHHPANSPWNFSAGTSRFIGKRNTKQHSVEETECLIQQANYHCRESRSRLISFPSLPAPHHQANCLSTFALNTSGCRKGGTTETQRLRPSSTPIILSLLLFYAEKKGAHVFGCGEDKEKLSHFMLGRKLVIPRLCGKVINKSHQTRKTSSLPTPPFIFSATI